MTLSTTSSRVDVNGNSVATVFSFVPVVIFSAADLQVTMRSAAGVETAVTLGAGATNFSCDVTTFPGTGSITYPALGGTPLPTGAKLVIKRVLSLLQTVALSNQGAYLAKVQEGAFDYAMASIQQQQEQIGRTVQAASTDPSTPLVLPNSVARASKFFGFDASGNPVVVEPATALSLLGSVVQALASIAVLRAQTVSSLVHPFCYIEGYYSRGDGGEGAFFLSASGAADDGGTMIVDASGRRWGRALKELSNLSVHWFGAKGDGVTNDTSAVQSAINAVAANGGGRVVFSSKTYNFTGAALAISSNFVQLAGGGQFATTLQFANGANDCITIRGPGGAFVNASFIRGNAIRDLSITCVGKTGGRALHLNYTFNTHVERVYVNNCWTGFDVEINNTVTMRDCSIAGVIGGVGAYGVYFHGSGANLSISLTLDGFLVNPFYSGADGILWDGSAYTLNLQNVTMLDVRIGLHVRNSSLSNAYYPQYLEAANFTVDGAMLRSVQVDGGGNLHFTGCNLSNNSGSGNQGGADDYSVLIAPDLGASETHEVSFVNTNIGSSRATGLRSACKDLTLSACRIGAGITATPNTWPAMHILSPSADTNISGCKIGYFGNPNNWKYGLQMDAGTNRTLAVGNNFGVGALTNGVLNNSGDPFSFVDLYLGNTPGAAGAVSLAPKYTAPPPSPLVGQLYFNTTSGKAQMWDGTLWNSLW